MNGQKDVKNASILTNIFAISLSVNEWVNIIMVLLKVVHNKEK